MYETGDTITRFLNDRELRIAYRKVAAAGASPMMIPPDVLVAATLGPFVTAVAAALGTSLGTRIEDAAVRIVRRLPRPAILHRSRRLAGAAAPERIDAAESGPSEADVQALTVTTESGARIQLSTYTPVAALALLPGIDFSAVQELGDVPTTVRWISDGWHAVSIKDGAMAIVRWDADTRQWDRTWLH